MKSSDLWLFQVRHGLIRYYYPLLIFFGTVGNVLSLKILLRKKFWKNSTCQYLAVLAVFDILFIYTRSSRFIYRYLTNQDLRNTSKWICRTFIFFSSALSHIGSWILVVVSFDRYFLITNNYHRRSVGWRVCISTLILICIICLFNLYYFHILGTTVILSINLSNSSIKYNETRFVCIARDGFELLFSLYIPVFDILIVSVIPFLLMAFTNVGIIIFTIKTNVQLSVTHKRSHRRNHRVTVMLLSVTLAFMLLTCPSVIYICINKIMYLNNFTPSVVKLLIVDILESLWCTKHAINFILYTLSGQDFRREFMKLFQCRWRPQNFNTLTPRKITTTSTTMTTSTTRNSVKVQTDNSYVYMTYSAAVAVEGSGIRPVYLTKMASM